MRRGAVTGGGQPGVRSGVVHGVALTWLALAGLVSADASVPADSPLGQLVAERPVSTATTLPRLPVLFGLALENDSDLQSQRYQVKATEEQVDMAWSQLKPQVSVSGGYTYQESDNYYTDNPDYDPANDFVDTDYEARYAGQTKDAFWQLSLSQPLFSVERWRGVDKAESQVEAAQLQLALGESELAMAVVEAYLDALLASRQTGLLESKRESLELQHRQASRAYELGVGDRLNVLEAQARLDQTISDRILAENQLEDAPWRTRAADRDASCLRPDTGRSAGGRAARHRRQHRRLAESVQRQPGGAVGRPAVAGGARRHQRSAWRLLPRAVTQRQLLRPGFQRSVPGEP